MVSVYKIKRFSAKVVLNIALSIGALFMAFPFIWMILSSFKPGAEIFDVNLTLWPKEWIFENYIAVFQEVNMAKGFLNSLAFSTVTTIAVVILSSLGAYMFIKLKYRGSNILFFVLMISLMVPPQTAAISLYILWSKLNLVDSYIGLYIPMFASAFSTFLVMQFIRSLPDAVFDSAKIDGATDFGIYLRVLLPMIRPVLSIVAILNFIGAWDSFFWPFIIINSEELKTLPLMLVHFRGYGGQTIYTHAMAAACVVVVPVIIIFLFFQRNIIENFTMTGTKG